MVTCLDCGREVPDSSLTMHQLRACSARARRPGDENENDEESCQSCESMDVDDENETYVDGGVAVMATAMAALSNIEIENGNGSDSSSDDDSDVQIIEGGNPARTRSRTEQDSLETPSRDNRRQRRRLSPEIVEILDDTPSPISRSQPQPQPTNTEENRNQWTCPQCTLYNHKNSRSCVACLYPNPEHLPDGIIGDLYGSASPSSSPPMSPLVFVGGGALMGGILGAAGSFIHGRDPFSAAAEGALTGVMGGVFLNQVVSTSDENERINVNASAASTFQQHPPFMSVAQARSSASISGGYPSMMESETNTNRSDNYARARPRSSFRVVQDQNQDGTTTTMVMGGNATTRIRQSQRVNNSRSHPAIDDAMLSLQLHHQLVEQGRHVARAVMLGLGNGQNDVDHMGYEELLRAFGDGTENMGASDGQIASLPTRVIQDPQSELPEDARQCSICLEDICSRETRKIMPCLHGFHASCCDKWLRTNGSCPICKHRLR